MSSTFKLVAISAAILISTLPSIVNAANPEATCDPAEQANDLNDKKINLKIMKEEFQEKSSNFVSEIDNALQGGCFSDQAILGLFNETKEYQEKLQKSVVNHIDKTIERIQVPFAMPEGNEGTCGPAFHTMVSEIADREDIVNKRREKVSNHVESEERISQTLSEPKSFEAAKPECLFRVFTELNSIRGMAKEVVRIAKDVEKGFQKNKKRLTCYRLANREIEAKCEVGSKTGGAPIGTRAATANGNQTGFKKGFSDISEDPTKKNIKQK